MSEGEKTPEERRRELRRVLQTLENHLYDDDEVLDALDTFVQVIREAVDLGKDRIQYGDDELDDTADEWVMSMLFIEKSAPEVLKATLKQKIIDVDIRKSIHRMFKWILKLVVVWVPLDDPDVAWLLRQMFNRTQKLFLVGAESARTYSLSNYGAIDTQSDEPMLFAEVPKYTRACPMLIELINYFGALQGFDAILRRFDSRDRADLNVMVHYLRAIHNVRPLFTLSFLDYYVPALQRAVFEFIESMSPQELKDTDKGSLGSAVSIIETLLEMIMTEEEAGEISEQFQLKLAHTCFVSESFQKRHFGFTQITMLINNTLRKEMAPRSVSFAAKSGGGSSAQRQAPPPVSKWLTSEFLLEWLEQNGIIAELFGDRFHHELVGRADALFKFLAKKDAFSTEHIDVLWSSCWGKSELRVSAVYKILLEILPHIRSFALLEHLFSKFEAIPHKEFDNSTLDLLDSLTRIMMVSSAGAELDGEYIEHSGACDVSGAPNSYGLCLLWDIMQEECAAPEDVSREAAHHLFTLFQNPMCREHRVPFIHRCLHNLREHRSVPQSLELIQEILDHFPTSNLRSSGTATRSIVIDSLAREHDLIDVFFRDLVHYKERAASRASELVKSEGWTEHEADVQLNTARLVGGIWGHFRHIKTRVDFLHYLLTNSSNSMTVNHTDLLWQGLIVNAITSNERDLCFRWFKRLFNISEVLIDPELVRYIFEEKLCRLDFRSVSECGFRCLERAFRLVNARLGLLDNAHDKHRFKILDLNLVGLDSMWALALEVRDEGVAAVAMEYMTSFYDRVSSLMTTRKGELREAYITIVMDNAHEAMNHSPPRYSSIERCIAMLRAFVDDYEMRISTSSGLGGGIPITVPVLEYKARRRLDVRITRNATLAEVRDKIALELNKPIASVRLMDSSNKFFTEKLLNEDLETLGIDGRSPLRFLIVAKIANGHTCDILPPERDPLEEGVSPSNILANTETFFSLLFKLLDSSPRVSAQAWDLILHLPINRSMRERVQNIPDDCDWESLIEATSPYKLLYSLQIVESIATEQSISRSGEEEKLQWCARFIESGGLRRLYHTLRQVLPSRAKCNSAQEADLWDRSCSLLLRLMNEFALVRVDESTDAAALRLRGDVDQDWLVSEELIHLLIQIVWETAKADQRSSGGIAWDIVVCTLLLLQSAIMSNPEQALPVLLDRDDLKHFVYATLVCASNSTVRDEVGRFVEQLSKIDATMVPMGTPHPCSVFLPMLVSFLDSIEANAATCNSFFRVLNHLMSSVLRAQRASDPATSSNVLDVESMVGTLVRMLVAHESTELDGSSAHDTVLIGLFVLLASLFKTCPEMVGHPTVENVSGGMDVEGGDRPVSLMQYLYVHCMFEVPGAQVPGNPPKCKVRKTRAACFGLMKTICLCGEEQMDALFSLVRERHLSLQYEDWAYAPSQEQRADVGYCGIENLGFICYMNALLQQLYMMPMFRKGILSLPLPSATDEKELGDNTLYQLQTMFAYLQQSQKQAFDPTKFCASIKDYDGNPVDVHEQQDTDEFFNNLTEKVEEALKGTPQEKLVDRIYDGKLCTQLIGKGCPHYSERAEPFHALSIDIKGKVNIVEALESYVSGEMLEGDNAYKCEKCDKNVDTLLRRCVKTLPSTLILHLKRFEFNFDVMGKVKLNDLCEFPFSLNMEPYTVEGLAKKDGSDATDAADARPPEYYEYELVGILVHQGVADSGHYYSFIKERVLPSGAQEPRWLEFNDELVRPFDIANIERECFGGTEEVMALGSDGVRRPKTIYRTRNAYLLVYERTQPLACTDDMDTEEQSESPATEDKTPKSKTKDEFVSTHIGRLLRPGADDDGEFVVSIPKRLYSSVWRENYHFLQDRHVFDEDYFSFMHEVVKGARCRTMSDYCVVSSDQFKSIEVGVAFLLKVLSHSKNIKAVRLAVELFKERLSDNIPACRWFLETITQAHSLRPLLLECTLKKMREHIVSLISHTMSILLKYEERSLFENDQKEYADDDDEDDDSESSRMKLTRSMDVEVRVTKRLIEKALKLFRFTPYQWRTFGQYFMLLADFAECGDYERIYLIEMKVIPMCMDLLLGDDSPNEVKRVRVMRMGNRQVQPDFSHLVRLLSILGRSIDMERDEGAAACPYAVTGEYVVEFDEQDQRNLRWQNEEFFNKVVEGNINMPDFALLVSFWIWENIDVSDSIMELIIARIDNAEFDGLAPWFNLLYPLLEVADTLQQQRVAFAMGQINQVMRTYSKYLRFTEEMALLFLPMYDVPVCRNWMVKNKEKWIWIDSYLRKNKLHVCGFGAPKENTK